jgi:uncharacterized protein YndB with AHSA1/START domain
MRSIVHASFTVERSFAAPPARVFAALANQEMKAKWFVGPPGWTRGKWEMDFRPGGKEYLSGGPPGGTQHIFDALYLEIVDGARVILAYNMFAGDTKLSVSLQTVELQPEGKGTRFVLTEHGAFLDGHEDPKLREDGTRQLVVQLEKSL